VPPIVIVAWRGSNAYSESSCENCSLNGLDSASVVAPEHARFASSVNEAALFPIARAFRAKMLGQALLLRSQPPAEGSKGGLPSPDE
jgi:hypothetical protein